MVCERYLALKTTTVVGVSIYPLLPGALWTVEHHRVCSVVGKKRQLIFLVVIDC